MMIQTRDFGELEIDQNEIVTFVEPIFGFDQYHRFIFLFQEDLGEQIAWLQSVEEPELCFIVASPALVRPGYCPQISASIRKKLGNETCQYWLVTVVRDQFQDSTVNLKSPIILAPEAKRAVQVILDEDLPLRHPLFAHKGGR